MKNKTTNDEKNEWSKNDVIKLPSHLNLRDDLVFSPSQKRCWIKEKQKFFAKKKKGRKNDKSKIHT